MKTKMVIMLLSLLLCSSGFLYSQFVITTNVDASQSVSEFILSGVEASNVVLTGAETAFGTFTGGNTTNLGINSGIVLTTGTLSSDYIPAMGSHVDGFSSYGNNTDGDILLNNLVSVNTYDAIILEFDLIPEGNMLEFQYVFASEEYPEYVNTSFNDVFAFFIDGQNPEGGNYEETNIALIPGTNLPVCIDNVNADTNSEYFVDNQDLEGQTIVFDGFTTVLTVLVEVVPGTTYHLKIAIADAGDVVWDSAVFLMSPSLKSYNVTDIESKEIIAPELVYNNTSRNLKIGNISGEIESLTLTIYNLQGSLIYEENISTNEIINLSEFNEGMYLVKISSGHLQHAEKIMIY